MPKSKSRTQQWNDACSQLEADINKAKEASQAVEDGFSTLRDLQSDFESWKDNLPENLQSSPLGEKLENITGIDLDWTVGAESLDEAEEKLSEAQNAEIPQGFGRD